MTQHNEQPPDDAVRVVIVDDHQIFRTGLRAELGPALNVVGEAASVDEALEVILATTPDVVLLDVHLPGGDGGGGAGAAAFALIVWGLAGLALTAFAVARERRKFTA